MTNSIKWFLGILILLIVIVIGFFGWQYYQKNHNSNWKTYKNKDLGFSFTYPANLTVNDISEEITKSGEVIPADNILSFLAISEDKTRTNRDYYFEVTRNSYEKELQLQGQNFQNLTKTDFMLDGAKGVKATGTVSLEGLGSKNLVEIIIPYKNNVYIFGSEQSKTQLLLDILATYKFAS